MEGDPERYRLQHLSFHLQERHLQEGRQRNNQLLHRQGPSKGKTYYYKVACYVNYDGKQAISAYSSVVSVKAAAPAPAQVSAKKAKSGAAKITWSKSTGANGYEVYMAASAKGKFTKAGTISKSATVSFTKSGLKSGKTYFFKVRAYTTVGGKKVYSDYTKTVKVKV